MRPKDGHQQFALARRNRSELLFREHIVDGGNCTQLLSKDHRLILSPEAAEGTRVSTFFKFIDSLKFQALAFAPLDLSRAVVGNQ
jgi:hypothetical protein